MITHLDHVAIVAKDWERAVERYGQLLGQPAQLFSARGHSAQLASFRLSNTRILLLRPECACAWPPDAEPADAGRKVDEGLAALAFGTAEGERCAAQLRARGLRPSASSQQGIAARIWDLARADSRGLWLRVVEGSPGPRDGSGFADDQLQALDHVVIRSAAPERAQALYAGALGLRLALDRELHGARMLFFRSGGVTLEVIADTGLAETDVYYGLAYRVRDLTQAHARLAAAGFSLSEPRPGRKPGTQVFGVRSPTFGVPTLVIRDPSRD